MPRPRHERPTPAELEVLKVLWDRGSPATVRDILEALDARGGPSRAYTSVMSLVHVMADKGLLRRVDADARAHSYEPASPRDDTLRGLLGETLQRAYEGSTRLLLTHLLDQSNPTPAELDEIRALIDAYQSQHASSSREGHAPCDPPRSRRSKR